MQRIGVFICWCGSNIAATVDVKKVAETIKSEPGVVYSVDYQYMCSENGQQLIKNAIKEHNLTAIVVGSCSPRMHEATFRKTAEAAGLNPYLLINGNGLSASSAPSGAKASYNVHFREQNRASGKGRDFALVLLAVARLCAAFL